MNILDTIEADLGDAGGWLEAEAESFAEKSWSFLGGVFKQFAAGEAAILADAATAAWADVTANPIGTLLDPTAALTALLNRVEAGNVELVAKITEHVAMAFLGLAGMNARTWECLPAGAGPGCW